LGDPALAEKFLPKRLFTDIEIAIEKKRRSYAPAVETGRGKT